MKLFLEQPTYSLSNNQERIEYFQTNQLENDKDPSLSIETIKSVLENRFFSNSLNKSENSFDYFCSSLSKRIETYSLSNSHPTMTITHLSEEQTNSIDYDNTYLSSEEISRLDDSSSFTTITSNFIKKLNSLDKDSDTDESSEEINSKELLTSSPSNSNFTEQIFSDSDNVNHYFEQNNPIRSSVDIVSLDSSMTSSMTFTDKQLNKQRTNQNDDEDGDDDDDYYIIAEQQKTIDQLTVMNNENEIYDDDDEYLESTRLFDNGQHDGIPSDESQYSDDFRYSSNTIRNSYINDDISHTSSTLRQEAIAITKVRCKQRQAWLHSSTNHIPSLFVSNNQVDGTNDISSCLNANMNLTTPTMLLHKNSLNYVKNKNKNGETPSYDFIQVNHDHLSLKTDESTVSPLLKTNNTHDKDASSTSRKTNKFYLIHHQSSLTPVKDLLNQKINSNIEVIQMDEQECVLEIVDGVVTLVPRDTSASTNSDDDRSEEQQQNSIEYQTNNNSGSPKPESRSSSRASSISTPSISEHKQERDEVSSSSSSHLSSNKEQVQEPFVLSHDIPPKSPLLPSQTEQSADLLDLFSTPPVPSSNTNSNDKNRKNLLDDSLSSISSYENNNSNSELLEKEKIRSSSPKQNQSEHSSPSTSIKDDLPPVSSPTKESTLVDESEVDYPIPKTEPPPVAKPINKTRINEFASLLSASVHLIPPQINKTSETPKTIPVFNHPAPSPARSEDQSFSSIPSAGSDRDERESYHTVKSNTNSEFEQTKKPIDARYNEKIDDRNSIQINTSNIKALFEQKISDTNKALSQSSEHLLHLTEARQQNKKVPNSYASLKHNLPVNPQPTIRRQSFQDSSNMNKYTDHIEGTKDVVIEDKQPEQGHQIQHYAGNTRRNNTEQITRPGTDSLTGSSNGYYSESLIAREIRETKEKEEELRQQRKKCGLPEDVSSLLTITNNNSIKPDTSSKQPIKSSSFLSNLDFFTSKSNEPNSSRRSTVAIQNIVYDSHGTSSSNDEHKPKTNVVSQELNRLNDNGTPIIRANSTNNSIHRSSSNQNIPSTQNTNNIIQREIEAIRVKEAELRQLGRIQHTSDEHSDPRKYQEFVSTIPKSQSVNILSTGKIKRDAERFHGPMTATSNGILKPKSTNNNNSSITSTRGRFPSPNPTAPIISSSNKSTDYSKLSSTDRLELEKRDCQEREQELRKQRHSTTGTTLSVNSTLNGDSGNVSQDEHDDDQERYFDKIARLKRTENEKAQAPLIRPTKKLNLSQKWEQMMANKNNNTTGDDDDDDDVVVDDKF